jgi:hypothetical protein
MAHAVWAQMVLNEGPKCLPLLECFLLACFLDHAAAFHTLMATQSTLYIATKAE